jgi:hypothetical protein
VVSSPRRSRVSKCTPWIRFRGLPLLRAGRRSEPRSLTNSNCPGEPGARGRPCTSAASGP